MHLWVNKNVPFDRFSLLMASIFELITRHTCKVHNKEIFFNIQSRLEKHLQMLKLLKHTFEKSTWDNYMYSSESLLQAPPLTENTNSLLKDSLQYHF